MERIFPMSVGTDYGVRSNSGNKLVDINTLYKSGYKNKYYKST